MNEEVNSKFVFYNTLTNKYKKWVKIMSARSGQPGINSEEYGSYSFYIPIRNEQDKIAKLLTKIDNRI
ncbi:restriction endonuclease subunit S, partial [Thomasclavelia cocleata]|uniref:restriction endonuclease subunit S n=1 Tax=Thomasclavelia cocleata TaxID=69824 RepID=UPI003AF19109